MTLAISIRSRQDRPNHNMSWSATTTPSMLNQRPPTMNPIGSTLLLSCPLMHNLQAVTCNLMTVNEVCEWRWTNNHAPHNRVTLWKKQWGLTGGTLIRFLEANTVVLDNEPEIMNNIIRMIEGWGQQIFIVFVRTFSTCLMHNKHSTINHLRKFNSCEHMDNKLKSTFSFQRN